MKMTRQITIIANERMLVIIFAPTNDAWEVLNNVHILLHWEILLPPLSFLLENARD